MNSKKNYTTPVWWIGFIILVEVFFISGVLYALQSTALYNDEFEYVGLYRRRILTNQLISDSVIVVVLLAEAITYWKIRKRIVRKGWVWGHISGLLLAFVITPLIFIMYTTWLSRSFSPNDYQSKWSAAAIVRSGFLWAFLIIGHTCFVLVLIDAFKKRGEEPESPAPDNPDILNDHA